MTAALLERLTTATNGCRFSDWCDGSDEPPSHVSSERNHWSRYAGKFSACDVDERIGVQLYGYENDNDGIDPVQVYLSIGDNEYDEDGISLPADAARAFGEALQAFMPKRPTYEDALVHAVSFDGDGSAVTAEFRHERWKRRGVTPQQEHIEFSVRPHSGRKYWIRVRLSLVQARAFGRCLSKEADRAASSNRQYGLVEL